MIYVLLLLTSLFTWAKSPSHWNTISGVSEQHEFYKNFEPIIKPKDSWQHLFSLSYVDRDLRPLKDCVFFRVPGTDSGTLKIKTISSKASCEPFLLTPGDSEITNIKLLQYAIFENKLNLDLNFSDLKTEKWSVTIQENYKRPEPKLHLSSVEFKSSKLIMLAAKTTSASTNSEPFLKDGELCHDVNEDCESKTPSKCDHCAQGWYEFPNGCAVGPKYCGVLSCGGKDQPACRRGMKWQRKDDESFDCRMNSSFAYCSKGLSVQCDGKKAFCR